MSGPLWTPRAAAGGVDVVGVGQVSLDVVCRTRAIPAPGGKGEASEVARCPGGQVATALLGCARLGLRARFVSAVGDDAEGREALAPLAAAGVDVSSVVVRPGLPSRTAQIWLEEGGGRAILGHRDPALTLRPQEVPLDAVRAARVLHLDTGDPEAAREAARAARAAGVPVVLDVDSPAPDLESLVGAVDFPVVSGAFAETFFRTSSMGEALAGLVAGGARMAVVTLGRDGALALTREGELRVPAFRVAALDTTGAGDAFMAGLIWGLLEGRPAAGVLEAAAAMAAMNCRALGAQGGLPDRAGLLAFEADSEREPWRDPDA